MDTAPPALEVDLHRLDLRFADTRLLEPRALAALARSIEQCGQLIACSAVSEADGARLVLVDGYRRIAALRRLGRDTACVEAWACDLAQALLTVLARANSRPLAALEEALLLRELVHGHALSVREVARRSGHDVSWVSRRLELVGSLSERLFAAVRQGEVSTWAATRVLAPLARANTDHADQLLTALADAPLSTRELQTWFQHYQTSPQASRARLVTHPRLFIDALHARDEQHAASRLRAGPEGQCATAVRQLLALSQRLRSGLAALTPLPLPAALASALSRLRGALAALQSDLARTLDHDAQPDSRCGTHSASPGPEPAPDQPRAPALA